MFSILSLFTEDVKLRHDPMNNPNNPNNPYGTGPSRQGKEPFESEFLLIALSRWTRHDFY